MAGARVVGAGATVFVVLVLVLVLSPVVCSMTRLDDMNRVLDDLAKGRRDQADQQ